MPLDLIMGAPTKEESQAVNFDAFIQKAKEDAESCYEKAREELKVAAERRKRTYDIRVRKADFRVGEWVWYWYPRRYTKRSPKWQKMYVGPFLVTRIIEPVNYVIQRSARAKPIVVHVDKLKRCYGETPNSWLNPSTSVDVEIEPTYVIEITQLNTMSAPTASSGESKREKSTDKGKDGPSKPEMTALDTTRQRPRRDARRKPAFLRDYQC